MWDSTDALELKTVPKHLLVMGGGIIGLEMGTVYHALVQTLTWLKCSTRLSAADKDIVKSLHQAYQQEIQPDAGNQSDCR